VDAGDRPDSCGAQGLLGRVHEIELAPTDDLCAVPLAEGGGDLLADLVAAGPDPGADHGGELAPAELAGGRLDDAAEEAPPADMEGGDRGSAPVRAGERHREAVGGEDEERLAGLVRPDPVA